jgi:hypothetical protein
MQLTKNCSPCLPSRKNNLSIDDQSLFADTTNNEPDPARDYLNDLVGEGKKYKTSADLARASTFKDAHIARLEAEALSYKETTERLNNDLSARARLEDLVDNISASTSKSNSNDGEPRLREPDPSSPALTPAQLEAQIDALLTKRDNERTSNSNRGIVKQKLLEKLGPNFASKVRDQGRAIGVGEAFLNQIAAENPAAFFRLIGIEDKPRGPSLFSAPPQSDINPDVGFTPSDSYRDKAYYDKLRADKGDRHYWSPAVQTQYHKDALADPIRFGLTDS